MGQPNPASVSWILGLNWSFINFGVLNVIAVTTVGLSPFLYTLGYSFNQPSLVGVAQTLTTPLVVLLVSTLVIVLIGVIFISATRNALRFMKWAFILAHVCFAVLVGVLLFTSHDAYVSGFNQRFAGGATYQGIVDAATKAGYQPGFTWAGTIGFLPLIFLVYFGWNWFGYVGGEIKQLRRNAPLAAIIIPSITLVLTVLMAQLVYNVLGFDFVNANNYLLGNNPDALPYKFGLQIIGTVGSIPLMLSLIPTSPVFLAIANLGFLISILWLLPAFYFASARSIFAWSFDRVIPTKFAEVNDRTHSPVWSVITISILYELLTILVLFVGISGLYVNLFGVFAFSGLIVSISGILYPYLRRGTWDAGPKIRIGNAPLITILGVISAAIWAWLIYDILTVPAVGGAVSYASFVFGFGGMLAAIPWFYIARAYQKARNINFDIQFREIPPE